MSTPVYVLEPLTKLHATEDTVAAAVHTFNDQANSASSIGDYLWEAFNAVFDVAGRTPSERQGRLLEFLDQLRQTTATDANGQPLSYEGGVVWKDMPSFGWVARDLWNFDVFDPSATAQDHSKWENWTAFLAQLTTLASADDPRDPFDFSLFALWDMRTAFEETPPDRADSASAVKHAAVWVRHAGKRLWRLCVDGRTLEGNNGVARGKYANREWRGFNEERWTAWKDELKAAQDKHRADGVVQEASELMERL
ncbi:hypothetical protein VTI74DRAFT_782 [Chaetomium olivicolor]